MKRIVDTTTSKMKVLAGAAFIIVACSLAYVPAVGGGFIWDDDRYVSDNPLLTAPDGLYRIWFTTDAPSQYFPLTYTSYLIEHKLWGLNPTSYHVVNVEIHIASALLLWLILRRLSIPGAWFASAVFALHPVQVESVAWISERKNVLMLFFSLLSVLCWVEFTLFNRSGRKAILLYIGSLLFYALALSSKTTACTLPAALVLILWLKRSPLMRPRWLQIVPFVAMGIGTGLLVMWWEKHHQGTSFVNFGLGLVGKILIAGRALWFYLGKLIWPANLTFSYPRWHIDPTQIWQYAWPAGCVMALACAWLLRERLGRATIAAILFFVAMLSPMLGFFSLYTFVYTFVADHYQYAASIGPIALVAAGGATVYRRLGGKGRFLVLSAAGVILVTLGVLTWRQSRIYTNIGTLWEDTLNKNPDSWMARSGKAEIFFRSREFEEAKTHLERAIELAPYMKTIHPRVYSGFYYNLAIIYESKGNLDEAVANFQKSLEIFEQAALTHYWLAEVLVKQGKTDEALTHYHRALEIAKVKGADYLAEKISNRLKAFEKHKIELSPPGNNNK